MHQARPDPTLFSTIIRSCLWVALALAAGSNAAAIGPPARDAGPAERDERCARGETRYPPGETHSPLSCAVVSHLVDLRRKGASRDPRYFMKVGDSISAGAEFMGCFEDEALHLRESDLGELLDTWQWFRAATREGHSPYARRSLAAEVSRTASWALAGTPSPWRAELAVANGAYALIMFGTNDLHYGGPDADLSLKFPWMFRHIRALIDDIERQGVIPIVSSIPPYRGAYTRLIPLVDPYNAILRALAESRRIPFVDYGERMKSLPKAGLRDDGIHPSARHGRLCDFGTEGLRYGFPLRNLLTLEALDRVRRATQDPKPEQTASAATAAAPLVGEGTSAAPYRVDDLPFSLLRPWRHAEGALRPWMACEGAPPSAEHRYRLTLPQARALRVMVVAGDDTDLDLAWFHPRPRQGCIQASHMRWEGVFPAGVHEFSVFSRNTRPQREYVFAVVPCDAGEPDCQGPPHVGEARALRR